ncbi:MAG TPA: hypothetical protein VNJ01_08090 [Bacteriovoracaceae bacterium]|nr:hypothetical protein [Bacteriovoracaceae bacterium]
MKIKNPLYVVKGKDVLEASSVMDLVVKKFNLEPMLKILGNILQFLFNQIKDYPTFKAVKSLFDQLVVQYLALVKKFGLA